MMLSYSISILLAVQSVFSFFPFKKDIFALLSHTMSALLTAAFFIRKTWPIHFSANLDMHYLYFIVVILLLWILALFYGYFFFPREWRRFASIGNLIVICGILCILADNPLIEFFLYETITLLTVPLVLCPISKNTLSAIKVYVLYFLITSALLLPICVAIPLLHEGTSILIVELCAAGIFFMTIKSAIYPFHGWLIKAMVAPIPVSSLFHAVVIVKVGILFTIKNLERLPYVPHFTNECISILACLVIVIFSIKNLFHNNLKKMLAYSTIIQLHYMICFISYGLFTNAIEYAISHSFSKIVLFMSCGCLYIASNSLEKKDFHGSGKILRIPLLLHSVAALSLIGFPLYNGFFQKIYALDALFSINNSSLLVCTFLISNMCMSVYLLDFVFYAFFYSSNNKESIKLRPYSAFLHIPPFFSLFLLFFCWILRL